MLSSAAAGGIGAGTGICIALIMAAALGFGLGIAWTLRRFRCATCRTYMPARCEGCGARGSTPWPHEDTMLDKDHRLQQIAARYTPPLAGAEFDALRERFTTRPVRASVDPALGRGRPLPIGRDMPYQRLEHGQIIRASPRVRMSRKKRLQQRRGQA